MEEMQDKLKMNVTRPGKRLEGAWRYVAAVSSVVLAWAVREALNPLLGNRQPFGAFYIAVLLVAWWAGWRAALVASVLSYLVADWSFLAPRHTLGPRDVQSAAGAIFFLLASGLITALTQRMRRTERSLQERTGDLAKAIGVLRQREGELRQLVEAMPQLVWIARPDGRHEYFNRRWREYTGLGPESFGTEKWFQLLHPDDRLAARLHWEHSCLTGEPYEMEYRVKRGIDGSYRWFLGRALPVRDEHGKVVRWFGTSTEIQELRETQSALEKARDELARTNQNLERTVQERTARLQEMVAELQHLSYSIVHDMRAPLRAIESYSSLVEQECGPKASSNGREYLLRMRTAAGRMDELITDVLAYSGITQRQLPLRAVDLAELLRGIVETYPMFQRPQAEVEIVAPLPAVLGNVAALTQCFSNLLENACKFAKPGRVPRIRIRAESRDERVRVFVEDDGIGIRLELQTRIFGLFQQVSRACEGTGVGLAIVRKAAERMGGRVGVESEEGKGSRFWVELRAAANDAATHSLAA